MKKKLARKKFQIVADGLAIAISLLLFLLGCFVLIGWSIGSLPLITLSMGAAMNEKTAICFLLTAFGIASLVKDKFRKGAIICASLTTVFAILSLSQEGSNWWETSAAPLLKGSVPLIESRMSVYTALSFLLIAFSLATSSFVKFRTKIFALGIFGPLITANGLAALLCYFAGILPSGGIGLGSVAFHTSVGIFIAGIGITALEVRSAQRRFIRWLPLLAGIAAMVIVVVIWQSLLASRSADDKILRIILIGGITSSVLVISMSFFSVRLYQMNDTLEERVRLRTQELSRANADLQRFSAVAAHDLRSPVSTMVSYAQLCIDEAESDPEDIKFYGTKIVETGMRSLKLMTSLLELARIGDSSVTFEKLSVQKILDYVVANLHAKILETKAEISADAPDFVCGDEIQLIQLFQNLIANAIKFTAPGVVPKIKITCLNQSDFAEFAVQDNGIGIPEDQAQKVFEVFGRADSTKSYEGTGLGLSVCKKIVEAHGGRIWFESTPGRGTTFFFKLKKPT